MSLNAAAIVLAAGESSRMGSPKPLLPLNGETFLTHLMGEIAASRVTRTVLVLGFQPEVILRALPELAPIAVINTNYALGQLSSFHVGLETVGDEPDAVLLCLADHPFISHAVIDALIQEHERAGSPILVPTHDGRRGHPTLFARSLYDELRAAPLDQGARIVVRAHATELIEVPTDNAGVVADIDTPEQYQQWLAWWREQQ